MKQLIECVPNFSEGNNMETISQITKEIEVLNGVRLLHVDAGKAANRTVITFVGESLAVCEAAFRVVKWAGELIDMSKQKGVHPHFGATDVCPLVPVSGISMEETAGYARCLGKRIGEELGIPVYCYEHAAFNDLRKNLANCREGQYEGLAKKMEHPLWKPDFGPEKFNDRVKQTGAIAVGARPFLVAYNVNLGTQSVDIAKAIAGEIRESGRARR